MAPQSVARGAPRKRGSGSGGDASTAPQYCWGAGIPLRGRIFLSEDTAPLCAVAPFASSPFAHPIPQTHRRASGDLFSASLRLTAPFLAGQIIHGSHFRSFLNDISRIR
jgi:hypothetical protein